MTDEAAAPPLVAVVGYDGSDTARLALRYAARRAGRDGRLILTYAISPPSEFIETPYYERSLGHHRALAAERLGEIEERLGVAYETEVVEAPPARGLVEVAVRHEADEIVVGSRGFGTLRAVLGSVSHSLIHETDRPLAIVPRAADAAVKPAGVTVVGFDGSEAAKAALDYAASRAGPGARIVTVYAPDVPTGLLDAPTDDRIRERHAVHARAVLESIPTELGAGGMLERQLADGPPVRALVRIARERGASEIVVGSHGHGLARAVLGSVSHALIHEADRPIVVVPERAVVAGAHRSVQQTVE